MIFAIKQNMQAIRVISRAAVQNSAHLSSTGSDAATNAMKRVVAGGTALVALNKAAGKVGLEGTTRRYFLTFSAGVLAGQLMGVDLVDIDGWKKDPVMKIKKIFDTTTSELPDDDEPVAQPPVTHIPAAPVQVTAQAPAQSRTSAPPVQKTPVQETPIRKTEEVSETVQGVKVTIESRST